MGSRHSGTDQAEDAEVGLAGQATVVVIGAIDIAFQDFVVQPLDEPTRLDAAIVHAEVVEARRPGGTVAGDDVLQRGAVDLHGHAGVGEVVVQD